MLHSIQTLLFALLLINSTFAAIGDSCSNSFIFPAEPPVTQFYTSMTGSNTDFPSESNGCITGYHNYWTTFTATSDYTAEAFTFVDNFETIISVVSSDDCVNFNCLGSNSVEEFTLANIQSMVRFEVVSGTTYYLVGSSVNEAESGDIRIGFRQVCVTANDCIASLDPVAECENLVCVQGSNALYGCPSLYDNAECDDGITCTANTCNPMHESSDPVTGCYFTPISDLCQDSIRCTLNICDPEHESADPVTGCYFMLVNSECEDEATCTMAGTGICAPDSEDSDGYGCVYTIDESVCDEYINVDCVASVHCDPTDSSADDITGCLVAPLHAICVDDGYSCSSNYCDPFDDTADPITGCTNILRDSFCDRGYECVIETHCDVFDEAADPVTDCVTTAIEGYCEPVSETCATNTCSPGYNGVDPVTGCALYKYDSRCDDGFSCTDDFCTVERSDDERYNPATGCYYSWHNNQCGEDSFLCRSVECMPTDENANPETGCIVNDNSFVCPIFANDGISCTIGICDPTAEDADIFGCTNVPDNDACNDNASCTVDICSPDLEESDSLTGCHYTHNNEFCSDGYSCTIDTCNPDSEDADDETGCVITLNNESCGDGYSCTIDTCNPGTKDLMLKLDVLVFQVMNFVVMDTCVQLILVILVQKMQMEKLDVLVFQVMNFVMILVYVLWMNVIQNLQTMHQDVQIFLKIFFVMIIMEVQLISVIMVSVSILQLIVMTMMNVH